LTIFLHFVVICKVKVLFFIILFIDGAFTDCYYTTNYVYKGKNLYIYLPNTLKYYIIIKGDNYV